MQCFKVSFDKVDRSKSKKKVKRLVMGTSLFMWGWLMLTFAGLVFLYPFLMLSNFKVLVFASVVLFAVLGLYIKFAKKASNIVMLILSGIALVAFGLTVWGIWTTIDGKNEYTVNLLEKLSLSMDDTDLTLFVPFRYSILIKYYADYVRVALLSDACVLALGFIAVCIVSTVTGLADRKADRLNNNLTRQHIIPFDDRISGVSFTRFSDKNSIPFVLYYDVIDEVTTASSPLEGLSAYDMDEVRNLFINCTDGTCISLLVDEPESAKEAVLEAKEYYFPTPEKRVCTNCGWFMIGARCPHCKGFEYKVYTQSES